VTCKFIQRAMLIVLLCSLAGYWACAAQKPCTISPVEIEEIKSDIRDVDRELADRQKQLAKIEAEVVDLQARVEEKREQLTLVQEEFDRAKKASGVTEGTVTEEKKLDIPASDTGF
jgi:peptidoglycan hydrolase CwlO-like protein